MNRKTPDGERLRQRLAELTRTSEGLRKTERRYHGLFEEAADGLVVVDPKTLAIVDFNNEACRRLGYSRKEFANLVAVNRGDQICPVGEVSRGGPVDGSFGR